MTRPMLRRRGPIGVPATALLTLAAAGPAHAAGATPPGCAGTGQPTTRACVAGAWVTDSYASQVVRTSLSLSHKDVNQLITTEQDPELLGDSIKPGVWTGVFGATVQQVTQNPADDLGASGLEFPVSVTVPALPAKNKHTA